MSKDEQRDTAPSPKQYMSSGKKIRVSDLQHWKSEGRKWAILTCYDYSTAQAFSDAGIEVLLIGDSAANVIYGYEFTQEISLEEIAVLARGVVRGAGQALVMVDLPFGTYEASNEQAVLSASEMLRSTGAHCVKIEGGVRMAERIHALSQAGITVCGHIGFTPQSVNALGGFKVQGRGEDAEQLLADAHAVQDAGASMIILEMVPAELAGRITRELKVPTIGIGAGNQTDAQVLVWQDMVALPQAGRRPKFAKQWATIGKDLTQAAQEYKSEVEAGTFPATEHEFQ